MQIVRQLDPIPWKRFVDEHPEGNIFHTPEMFQVHARAKGHEPSLWAVLGDNGEILALLPIVKLTLLNGPLRLLTTRAVAYGGSLSEPTERGKDALALLLQAYKQSSGEGTLFTELRNLSDTLEIRPVFQGSGFVYEDHLNFLVDLTQPRETIWRNVNRRKRDKINSSRNKGTQIEQITDRSGISLAYQFLQDVYARVKVPLADQSLFEAAFDVLFPYGMFQGLLARVGDQYAGTILLLSYHGRIYYWYIGADRSFSGHSPSELLVWHAIEQGKENGFQLFDFGGGGKPDQEYGPRDFKARFGGNLVNYGRYQAIHAGMRLKLSQAGYQFYRELKSRQNAMRDDQPTTSESVAAQGK